MSLHQLPRGGVWFPNELGGPRDCAVARVARRLTTPFDATAAAVSLLCLTAAALTNAAAMWAIAKLVAHAASQPDIQNLVIASSGDAVYGRLTLALVGNIQVRDFSDWLALTFTSASSVVGVLLVRLVVDLGMVLTGTPVLVFHIRPRVRRPTFDWTLIGVTVWLAYAVGASLKLRWSSGSGGDMVLSMLATKVVGVDSRAYDSATGHETFSLAMNVALICLVAGVGAVVGVLLARRRSVGSPHSWFRWQGQRPSRPCLLGISVVALLTGWLRPAVAFEPSAAVSLPLEATAARTSASTYLPSVVTIEPSNRGWRYVVDGRPEIILGIGYNAVTANESPAERAARYDRDFASMSAASVNTVAGWTESEFDDLFMRKQRTTDWASSCHFTLGRPTCWQSRITPTKILK